MRLFHALHRQIGDAPHVAAALMVHMKQQGVLQQQTENAARVRRVRRASTRAADVWERLTQLAAIA